VGRDWSNQGYAVITGGGLASWKRPTRAPSKSAALSGWASVAVRDRPQHYVDLGVNFRYFFARKTMFVKYAQGFTSCPAVWEPSMLFER
jgi:hypothetical protein